MCVTVRDNSWQYSTCTWRYVTIHDSVCTWKFVTVGVRYSICTWQYVTLRFIPFLLIKNTMRFIQLRGQGPQRILSLVSVRVTFSLYHTVIRPLRPFISLNMEKKEKEVFCQVILSDKEFKKIQLPTFLENAFRSSKFHSVGFSRNFLLILWKTNPFTIFFVKSM